MLAEAEYKSPLDYRDLLFNYTTANQAVAQVQQWLAPAEREYRERQVHREQVGGATRLRTELRDFYVEIGEYLAENEGEALQHYYVETTAYQEALAGTRTVFVGRKGTGKTANLIALSNELKSSRNNTVCVLQPVGYEIESLVRLFGLYQERDTKGYVVESLWKFLLLTEIANAAAIEIEERPLWLPRNDSEKRLLELLGAEASVMLGDFSVRLERCVSSLLHSARSPSVEQERKGISEALHETLLKDLRAVLGDVLSAKDRVAILIDNLDKAWARQADIARLAEFLFGLFSATNRLLIDLARNDSRRKPIKCTAAIFVRSDIFGKVLDVAQEPDKLAFTRLAWNDRQVLARVVEMRFFAAHREAGEGRQLWARYFGSEIRGMEPKEYILSRILPRPRDLVYLVKGAISMAVNRGHERVEAEDVLKAEYEYSRYAMDSVMVENSITLPQLEAVLYEFVGSPAVILEEGVLAAITRAGIPQAKHADVAGHLVGINFLGLETRKGKFSYLDEPRELKKLTVLSDKLAKRKGARRYQIHPAFRKYLEIAE